MRGVRTVSVSPWVSGVARARASGETVARARSPAAEAGVPCEPPIAAQRSWHSGRWQHRTRSPPQLPRPPARQPARQPVRDSCERNSPGSRWQRRPRRRRGLGRPNGNTSKQREGGLGRHSASRFCHLCCLYSPANLARYLCPSGLETCVSRL